MFKAQTLRVFFCLKRCIVILCNVKTNACSVIHAYFSHNIQDEKEFKKKYFQWYFFKGILMKSVIFGIKIISASHNAYCFKTTTFLEGIYKSFTVILIWKFSIFFRVFLVRDSQSNPKTFVLSLSHGLKIKHFQIVPVSKIFSFHLQL